MRISTTQIFTQGLQAFGVQQTKLAHLQQQISTGVRITKPSDDPAGSARVLELQQTIEINEQYQINIDLADQRLSLEDTVLQNIGDALIRIKELTIQGNSGSQDIVSRNAIANEVDERYEQLLSLANTIDTNGDFLFAGFQSGSQPFSENLTGSIAHVDFNGDQGQRNVQISQSRQINVDVPGRELFMQVSSATALNETVGATNTGTGVMAPAHVFDSSVYAAGDYRIVFTGANTYDVVDLSGPVNIVTGATYTDGENIDFQGIRTSITGVPVAGDSFNLSQGQFQDLFSIVSTISETLRSSSSNAQRTSNFAQALQDIDESFNQVLEARTSVGGRLNAMEAQHDDNEAFIVVTRETVGVLRDTDLSEAISQLTLEQTTLDAAQAVFARITSSSLFNFLR